MLDLPEKCRISVSAYASLRNGSYEYYQILMGFSTKWSAFCWIKGKKESTTHIYDGPDRKGYEDGDQLVEDLILRGYHFILDSAREIRS